MCGGVLFSWVLRWGATTLVLFNSPLPPAPGPSGPCIPGAWCDMCGCAGLVLPGLLAWWSGAGLLESPVSPNGRYSASRNGSLQLLPPQVAASTLPPCTTRCTTWCRRSGAALLVRGSIGPALQRSSWLFGPISP